MLDVMMITVLRKLTVQRVGGATVVEDLQEGVDHVGTDEVAGVPVGVALEIVLMLGCS